MLGGRVVDAGDSGDAEGDREKMTDHDDRS
jgi:hypothetical protein